MKSKTTTLIIGLCLIFFGIFILIDLLAQLNATTRIIQFWPAFLILVGVLTINPKSSGANMVSLGLVGLGALGVMIRLGVFQTPQAQAALAVLLGFTGIVVLVLIVGRPKTKQPKSPQAPHIDPASVSKSNRF